MNKDGSTKKRVDVLSALATGGVGLVLLLVGYLWLFPEVVDSRFQFEVPSLEAETLFENSYLYLWLHVFTVVPVFLLSFDRKVAYYKTWKFLFPAIFLIGIFFIVWDVYFTELGVWGFNHRYLSGVYLFKLPVEEWLFFVSVPFACIFIYECLNVYFPKDYLRAADKVITVGLMLFFMVYGLLFFEQLYTSTTCFLAAAFMLWHLWGVPNTYRTRFYLAYLVSWIPFVMVDGALTGYFTSEPVVLYNGFEFSSVRLLSIPIEDSFYSFLLLFGVVSLYEYFKSIW